MVPTALADSGARAEAPQRDAVEQEAECGCEDTDREQRRERDRQAATAARRRLVELEVEEGGREGDRAVSEVEDARRLVGEDEARRQDRVDGAGDPATQDEAEELAQSARLQLEVLAADERRVAHVLAALHQ